MKFSRYARDGSVLIFTAVPKRKAEGYAMTNESGCSALFLSVDEESSMKETAPFYVYEVRIHHISHLRRTLDGDARRYARKEEGASGSRRKRGGHGG